MSAASPLEALMYAARHGWPVFPCQWEGAGRKRPLIAGGFREASTDPAQIELWWQRWSPALIGLVTGRRSGVVVLDIDRKGGVDGFDTLDEIGAAILPATPMVHTASGGLHLYFQAPEEEIRNTAGARGRGLGVGLDIRGDGGYVIVPAPGSGYRWDPICHIDNTPVAQLPPWAMPRELVPLKNSPRPPVTGLSPYAEAALDSAVRRIIGAGNDFARRVLGWAAEQVASYNPRRPWRAGEARQKVERAFSQGLRHPRSGGHAG